MGFEEASYGTGDLIADLCAVEPFDDRERHAVEATLAFLRSGGRPFDRDNFAGHVTGSGFLLSPDTASVLLTHHAALGRWLQFGGHADGEADIRNVALRETREESGKDDIALLSRAIFDVDVHGIPENPRRNEPGHLHYDIRYVLVAGGLGFTVNAESKELEWVPLSRLLKMPVDESMKRMATKACLMNPRSGG